MLFLRRASYFLMILFLILVFGPVALAEDTARFAVDGLQLGMLRTDVDAIQRSRGRTPVVLEDGGVWYSGNGLLMEGVNLGPQVWFEYEKAVRIQGHPLTRGAKKLLVAEESSRALFETLGPPDSEFVDTEYPVRYVFYTEIKLGACISLRTNKLIKFKLQAAPGSLKVRF